MSDSATINFGSGHRKLLSSCYNLSTCDYFLACFPSRRDNRYSLPSYLLQSLILLCNIITGGARAGVHGHLHGGDDGQDPGRRLHMSQGELPAQPVEHHGLHRRHIWVSKRAKCPVLLL